jgi:hypothetical protein
MVLYGNIMMNMGYIIMNSGDFMKKLFACLMLIMLVFAGCSGNAAQNSKASFKDVESKTSQTTSLSEQIIEMTTAAVQTTAEATSAQSETSTAKSGETTVKPAPAVLFNGEQVVEIYSLDYANRRYHKVIDAEKQKIIAAKLEGHTPPPVENQEGQVGFLIFTDKSKYPFYIDEDPKDGSAIDKEIATLSRDCNALYCGVAQWLAYMSTSNIQRITFSGIGGYGFSLKEYSSKEQYQIDVDTADLKEISAVSAYLKGIEVSKKTHINDGPPNPKMVGSHYSMSIFFSTGVRYDIDGYESGISVYSSDLNQTIFYDCTEKQIKGLRDLMMGLDSAKIQKL